MIGCTQAEDSTRNCDLNKLPIGKESSCNSYFREDRRLNGAYRRLSSSITANDAQLLKDAQRRWIKYRDEKCQYDEEKAFEVCAPLNPSCENLTLDMCVIQLTSDRANELENFLSKPIEAKSKNFDFTRASRFGDENYEKYINQRNSQKNRGLIEAEALKAHHAAKGLSCALTMPVHCVLHRGYWLPPKCSPMQEVSNSIIMKLSHNSRLHSN